MAMIVIGRDVWAECISYSHLLYGQSVLPTPSPIAPWTSWQVTGLSRVTCNRLVSSVILCP